MRYGFGSRMRLGLILVAALMAASCATGPVVIEGRAQAAGVTEAGWRLQWKDATQQEETRTIVGREVTIRATSQLALWAKDYQSAIATASTPELNVFGRDVNPVAELSGEALAQFAMRTALGEAGASLGLTGLESATLQPEQEVTIGASYGRLVGTRFKVEARGTAVTGVILKTKSGTDHVIVLGLLPHPASDAQWGAFVQAVASSQHPATLGEPQPLVRPDQVSLTPVTLPEPRPGSGWLGVRVADVPADLARSVGIQTTAVAVITHVLPGSPAAQAQLRTNDLVLAVGGQVVASARDLAERIRAQGPNAEVQLRIWSQGALREIRVRLAPVPRGENTGL